MKASEENIFPACDKFFEEKHRAPTADEVIQMCGGGKKEVLAIKKKWEALNYLKENGLNVPVRWLSMLGDYFKSIQEDIDAERSNMKAEIVEMVESVKDELMVERQKRIEVESQNKSLLDQIEALNTLNLDLKASVSAAEMQVGKLTALKEKLNAEISEKTLQIRLQIDQINDLKQEHEHALNRLKDNYDSIVKDGKSENKNLNERLNQRIEEFGDKCDSLNDKLMVANSEKERVKTELQVAKKEAKEKLASINRLNSKNTILASKVSELEKQLSVLTAKAAQIPKLEALIESLKQQQMAADSAKRDGLEQQVEELSSMLKSLSEQVKSKDKAK